MPIKRFLFDLKRSGKYEEYMQLLDVNMPKVNGLLVLEMLREDEKYKKIPIIMISARRDVQTITKAAQLGCDSFVIKPFKLAELSKRIYLELFSVDLEFVQHSFGLIDTVYNAALQQQVSSAQKETKLI